MCCLTGSSSLWGYWNALTEILSSVSHTRRWALVKFLWGLCHQRQLRSTFCHPLLSALSVCLPFFSLLLSGFARGASLLQLQHSLDAYLLLPRGSLASPGHTRPLASRHSSTHCGGHEVQTTPLTSNYHLKTRREAEFQQQEHTAQPAATPPFPAPSPRSRGVKTCSRSLMGRAFA